MTRRRSLLASLGTGSALALAGCVGIIGGDSGADSGNTYLDGKEWGADPSALPFPTNGDEVPSATLPAPLRESETLSVPGDFETDLLMTFVYTHCNSMCPRLTAILAQVQGYALDNDYGGEVSFVETTFDPARDDAGRFRQWADEHNVVMEEGNWYFLRPESEERAEEVVQDRYGVTFKKTEPEGMDAYMFAHTGLILLANEEGYVERAYKLKAGDAATLTWQEVRDDFETLREREA